MPHVANSPNELFHLLPPSDAPRFPRPLLFVHGAWHGAWCWNENFLPYFTARGFEVLAADLPGHSAADRQNKRSLRRLGISDYVNAVDKVARKCSQPPVLIGHSMGGYIVQKYLEKKRVAESAMILLASVPPAGVIRTTLSIAAHYPLKFLEVLATLKLYPLVRDRAQSREHFFSKNINADDLTRFHEQIGDEAFRAFLDMLVFALPRPKRLRGVPALVLGARNDTIFTTREVQATAGAYDAELKIFPDMAHDMMLEPGWPAVADCMIAWLRTASNSD
jgi:pimeloyl-ACP methyl ester carboxylesterase